MEFYLAFEEMKDMDNNYSFFTLRWNFTTSVFGEVQREHMHPVGLR